MIPVKPESVVNQNEGWGEAWMWSENLISVKIWNRQRNPLKFKFVSPNMSTGI